MTNNLLDQLHETEVPPPPSEMTRDVHKRLNQWLAFAQTADLVLRAFGCAAAYFAEAVLGMINYSLTGKYPNPPRDEHRRDGNTPP